MNPVCTTQIKNYIVKRSRWWGTKTFFHCQGKEAKACSTRLQLMHNYRHASWLCKKKVWKLNMYVCKSCHRFVNLTPWGKGEKYSDTLPPKFAKGDWLFSKRKKSKELLKFKLANIIILPFIEDFWCNRQIKLSIQTLMWNM